MLDEAIDHRRHARGAREDRVHRLKGKFVVSLLRDAAEALCYLHGRAPPIVHRDLKPRNVIRRPDGSFAFIDFGSVRHHMNP